MLEVTSFKDIFHQLLNRFIRALRVFFILVKFKLFDLFFDAFEAAASQLLQSFAADITLALGVLSIEVSLIQFLTSL